MIDLATVGQSFAWLLGAGTIGGFVSGELTRRSATRETRKRHLGALLCDLLELRHGIIGLREIGKTLAALLPGQADQLTVALPAIMEMVASPGKLHEHYDSAIIELAAIDPLLAFHLRSKNLVGALSSVSKHALQDPSAMPYTAQAFKMFGEIGTSELDRAILKVAREIGRRVYQKTRKTLEANSEMPEALKQILALLPSALQAAQRAQVQAAEVKTKSQENEANAAKAAKAP
jgi:hypothetical protein